MLVISADAEEQVVLEAWSLTIGWSGELRLQVNDQERVLGPPTEKVETGPISQSQACRAAHPPLAQPALLVEALPEHLVAAEVPMHRR